MSEFGDLLRGFRERARMSQGALAKAVGIDKSYVSKLESGARRVTSRDLALALAQALGLTLEEIELWIGIVGYISPRQEMASRVGVSRLLEEMSPWATDSEGNGE
jgi:transcriptional regulator with XRE-family HTH domain